LKPHLVIFKFPLVVWVFIVKGTLILYNMNLVQLNFSYLNKGRPIRWHLLYCVNLLLNMFQMLIHPSSGACNYLFRCCVGWLEACWCYVVGLSVGDIVSECGLNHYHYGYHITNRQSRYITPTCLKSAYTTTEQVVTNSWRWMY